MKEGSIQIYTGDGKGKTTAAIGQAVRARGHGLKVGFIYFHKNPENYGMGELKVLKNSGIDVFSFAGCHPYFDKNVPVEKIREDCRKGLDFIEKIFAENTYDLLILDEINISLRDTFLNEREVIFLLKKKPVNLELILTGRGALESVQAQADLITEMKKIKHPYDQGAEARRGIEY